MKRTISKASFLLIISLFTTTTFAMQENLDVIGQRCVSVAEELTFLVNSNSHDRCAQKIFWVASFMGLAGDNLMENQIPEAWQNLNSALQVLIDISKSKSDCAYFEQSSYHYLFEVNHIKEEIERLSY